MRTFIFRIAVLWQLTLPWQLACSDEIVLPPNPNESAESDSDDAETQFASFMQPQPTQNIQPRRSFVAPRRIPEAPANPRFVRWTTPSFVSSRRSVSSSRDFILGREAKARVTKDGGSLLRKSPSALGVGVQSRTPIVNDPRVRGSRVGRLAASGSHWIPARIDLDTMLSKVDSRILHDIIVVKGPYSARYGPDFQFMDFQLLPAPRYDGPFEAHGATSFDYETNGEQIYGRQTLLGGSSNWGFRTSYGHRTGNNYKSGNNTDVPSSYKSRDFESTLGFDLTPARHLELSYLRLDQTDVEFPGQAFDIDFLVTDGLEIRYVVEDFNYADQIVVDTWYNRTRFAGSAQRPGKRDQFPFYDLIDFVGNTDVDSMSTGYRIEFAWGDPEGPQLLAGTDLRFIKQELNEISSGRFGLAIWTDANSPIPESHSSNPGVYLEYSNPVTERLTIRAGGRGDWVGANVTDDPAKLENLGLEFPQHSLDEILGTGEYDQDFKLYSSFITAKFEFLPCWSLHSAAGYAQRAPTLTELYAAESFLFLLQNGLNTATGDPLLRPERTWQIDLGMQFDGEYLQMGVNGFHAWVKDYVTFENTRVVIGPPMGQVEQVNLKYVNTSLATLTGVEFYTSLSATSWLTPFATLKYVEGTDRDRTGSFATRRATGGNSSVRVPGLPRGFFSGVAGAEVEPLPSIVPLEARLGVRIHSTEPDPRWTVEFSARVVDNQNRVAASLLETPTPGFTVFDLRSTWQPTDDLAIVAGVENLGDRNYREHLDFRSQNGIQVFQPGISFYVGTELNF